MNIFLIRKVNEFKRNKKEIRMKPNYWQTKKIDLINVKRRLRKGKLQNMLIIPSTLRSCK